MIAMCMGMCGLIAVLESKWPQYRRERDEPHSAEDIAERGREIRQRLEQEHRAPLVHIIDFHIKEHAKQNIGTSIIGNHHKLLLLRYPNEMSPWTDNPHYSCSSEW
jgi:hypothetical protein